MTSTPAPRVTIGMPVYNGAVYIEQALRSILDQTFRDFEIIVSDNASTDDTADIVARWAERDPRVLLIRQPANLGAAPNYNLLVHRARGEYFKWAAHDDVLAPTYLRACTDALDARPDAVLAYPTTVMINEQGAPLPDDPYDVGSLTAAAPRERFRLYLERAWPVCGCNAVFGLIRTAALRTTRLIGSYASSDKILLGELALLGPFLQIDDPLFLRREHPRSSVRANPDVTNRNAWFDTSAASRTTTDFIRWRWVTEYIRGVLHLPLGPAEQTASILLLRHHIARDRARLTAELKRPVKRMLARAGLRRETGT